jgi:hypothetical protein
MSPIPRPPTDPAERDARRAEALIERLRLCTLSALAALDIRDAQGLQRFMRERDTLFTSLEQVMPSVARLRAGHPLRRSLTASMKAVAASDARLTAALEEGRAEIAEELVGIRQESRSSAYRAAPAVGLALDLTR